MTKNIAKIEALEALQKTLFNRAEMLHNVCFNDEAINILSQCYGEKFIKLDRLRTEVMLKSFTLYDVIGLISGQIKNLYNE